MFSYNRIMIWSGMGFTLMILAFTVEIYFMFNLLFIQESKIYQNSTHEVNFIHLTNLTGEPNLMTSLTGAFRCSLAVLIAFSSIMGRAGYLEALIAVIFGTLGYEVNRLLIFNFSLDAGGGASIFVFGGFMGLTMGLIKRWKDSK